MKRKLMLGLLSAVGGLTIIGSGFSAWYFGDTSKDAHTNIGTHVTNASDGLGEVTLNANPTDLNLVLDQGTKANAADLDKGIYFGTYNTTTPTILDGFDLYTGDYGAKYTISAADSNNAKLAGLKTGVFKVKVTLAKVAAEYIEFKGTFIAGLDTATAIQTDTATGDVYFELIKDFSFGHADTTLSFDFDISTTDYTNAAFKYKAGKKPQGKAAHTTLQTALNEKSEILKFDYTFEAKAE